MSEYFPDLRLPVYENRKYLDWLKTQPCVICSAKPCDPAHQSCGFPSGTAKKAPDTFALPICANCHRIGEHMGGKVTLWKDFFLVSDGESPIVVHALVARLCLLYFTRFLEENGTR